VTCQGNAGTYTSNPAPGGTFTFTSNVGVAATTQVLQIGNSGNTAIQVGPPAIGGGNGPFTVTPNTGTIPVAAGAANADTYTIGCTPTAVGLVTKTLTIPVSGDPARTSATYTLSCTGNGAKLSSNPPPGGTLTLTGNPSALLNGNISVTNSGNQDLTVTGCNAPAGFTVDTTAVALVTPGATVNITVSCTAPATQGATVSADLICTTTNDPTLPTGVTYHLSCNALVLSIPAMSAAGKGLLVMLVLGLGLLGFRMRRQSA
jgi:hypothetical protein